MKHIGRKMQTPNKTFATRAGFECNENKNNNFRVFQPAEEAEEGAEPELAGPESPFAGPALSCRKDLGLSLGHLQFSICHLGYCCWWKTICHLDNFPHVQSIAKRSFSIAATESGWMAGCFWAYGWCVAGTIFQ